MSSTNIPPAPEAASESDWRAAGLRYHTYGFRLRQRFGRRVQKISLDAGFTCPNVDGTVAVGGCVYCDNRSFSPSRRLPRRSLAEQLDEGVRRIRTRYACDQFIAYFQPATNTYAPPEYLRQIFSTALAYPGIVGLAIGTRPDCVPEPVLDLLSEFAARTYLSVEYGVQTIHDRSLAWMNRGHNHAASLAAIERSRGRGFEIGVHVILGLPGESRQEMLATASELARLKLDSLKLHNLYAVQRTVLAEQLARGEVALLERDEYVRVLVDFLELLPPSTVIERIGGDAPPEFLVAPAWCLDRPGLRAAVERELTLRNTWQGRLWAAP